MEISGNEKEIPSKTCNYDKNLQELTWQDVQRIVKIYQSTGQLTKQGWLKDREEIYKEVLKRFNEQI